MGGDPQAMGAERSHRAPPAGHSRSAPVSWVLATASWITTVDHKRIGILYGVTAFAFFLLGGLEALLIRLQLAAPDAHVVSAETYNALFTMHGTTMVFLAIMPLNAAFFNYMVPLLIGARDVAFPRLNALSYWILLFGGLFLNASFLVGTPPDVGWFGYANLTSKQFSPSHSVDFWLLSLQLLGVSSMIAAINFIVTILNMRPPGMRLMRMPVFVWMTLVVQFLIVLAFPPITVGSIFLMFDRFFGSHFYDVAAGGDLHLWQHLFWIFGHPEVYILILPAFGIVSEVLPTFARKPLFGAPVVVYSGVLIGFFGFGVWSHHMFAAGMGPVADAAFSIATMLIAIPTGVKIFNWLATLWGGSIRATTAFHFAVGLVGLFTIGGLSGIMHASPPVDLQQTDSYFVVAHLHYVLIGGSLFGLFAAAAARFRHDPSGPRERHVLEREVWSARGPPCPHPRPHPPPGSVPLAGGGRARHGGPGGRRAHPSHDRADGRARHDRRHLPPGTRAPPDPRARAPDGRPRPRPSEGRAVGVPRLRMLLLRHADRDVPRLQGKERGRPRTPRDPQHPADDGLDLRPPDVEPAHGAGAGGRRAGRPASRPPLAVRDGVLRADLPRLPGLGVHAVRAGRADPSAEPVRLDLLRADRLPRRARGRGRGLAPLALAPRPPRSPPGRRRRQGGGGGALLALRGRRMDRDLHARLSDPVRAADVNVTGAHATVRTYLKVALVLTGVTILEVGSIYIRQLTPIIVPLLLAMSAAKFALVVLFFMHLRYESRVLTLLFCGPLLLATGIMIALMTLTGAFLVFGR